MHSLVTLLVATTSPDPHMNGFLVLRTEDGFEFCVVWDRASARRFVDDADAKSEKAAAYALIEQSLLPEAEPREPLRVNGHAGLMLARMVSQAPQYIQDMVGGPHEPGFIMACTYTTEDEVSEVVCMTYADDEGCFHLEILFDDERARLRVAALRDLPEKTRADLLELIDDTFLVGGSHEADIHLVGMAAQYLGGYLHIVSDEETSPDTEQRTSPGPDEMLN